MNRLGVLMILAATLVVACGAREPPAQAKPQPTVFDDLIDKKRSVPADIENAQRKHIEELRRQDDAANGVPPPPPPR